MKQKATKINLILLLTLIFTSCGEIKKGIAGDQLIGTFSGKATFVYKHSLLNIGLDDEFEEATGTISIYKNQSGQIFISTGDGGDLKLSGISLASNGTTFNIPSQNVSQKDGSFRMIQGQQVAELDGVKFDGIYYSESNVLSFAYETSVLYDFGGISEEVSVICVYEFAKI